jgi:TRAP-type C4-dicarboxylate transport system substrate-binding protein
MEPLMKNSLFLVLCVCISLALFSLAPRAGKVTLKLAHNLERSHVVHQALRRCPKRLTNFLTVMKIRIYPSSQMGSARETMELLQNGALDMTKGSASDLESFR